MGGASLESLKVYGMVWYGISLGPGFITAGGGGEKGRSEMWGSSLLFC